MIGDIKQQMLLITELGREEEAITRLARVGYDGVVGYLKGGFDTWENADKPMNSIHRISVEEFEKEYASKSLIIDVRKKSEFESEHIIDAINIPANQITKCLAQIPKDKPFILHCAGGYRSMIVASILMQNGWEYFSEVRGGFAAITKTGVPTTDYVCPITLL